MKRLSVLAAVAFALAYGVPVCTAGAEPLPLSVAIVGAETPISAGGGWLLWSVRASGGWGLEAYHEGRSQALPVRPRPQPFDVSVGTDARGAAVATFSRCARTPKMRDVGETEVTGGSLLEPRTGAGCRVYLLELGSGRERRLPIPHPSGASDTTPSMWRGSVVFARRAPGHGDVWQVMLWSPGKPRTVRTLKHGATPSRCRSNCGEGPIRGEVEALDRDGGLVTFLWAVEGPGVLGEGPWELRVDDLANGHSSLAEAGYGHEACTGPPDGLEYVWPEAPIANGAVALFPQLEGFSCFRSFASVLGRYRPGAKRARSGPLADPVLGLAKDGDALYGLLPVSPWENGGDSPNCSALAPCTIERITAPSLTPDRFRPAPPFLE
jgi:hypothetical protein